VLWVRPSPGCVEAGPAPVSANTAAYTAAHAAAHAGVTDFASLRAREPDTHLVSGRQIQGSDIAAYFHTGGSTGSPKLARHSHAAQVYTACVQLQGVKTTDVSINGYPLFHAGGGRRHLQPCVTGVPVRRRCRLIWRRVCTS